MIIGKTQAMVLEYLKSVESAPYNKLRKDFGANQRTLDGLIGLRMIVKEERYPKAIYRIDPINKNTKYIVGNGINILKLKCEKIEREYDKMKHDKEFKK